MAWGLPGLVHREKRKRSNQVKNGFFWLFATLCISLFVERMWENVKRTNTVPYHTIPNFLQNTSKEKLENDRPNWKATADNCQNKQFILCIYWHARWKQQQQQQQQLQSWRQRRRRCWWRTILLRLHENSVGVAIVFVLGIGDLARVWNVKYSSFRPVYLEPKESKCWIVHYYKVSGQYLSSTLGGPVCPRHGVVHHHDGGTVVGSYLREASLDVLYQWISQSDRHHVWLVVQCSPCHVLFCRHLSRMETRKDGDSPPRITLARFHLFVDCLFSFGFVVASIQPVRRGRMLGRGVSAGMYHFGFFSTRGDSDWKSRTQSHVPYLAFSCRHNRQPYWPANNSKWRRYSRYGTLYTWGQIWLDFWFGCIDWVRYCRLRFTILQYCNLLQGSATRGTKSTLWVWRSTTNFFCG